jgi:hypothetical protein
MLRVVNAMDCFSLERKIAGGIPWIPFFVEIGSPGKNP